MNIDEVISKIGQDRLEEFMQFMEGQTVGLVGGHMDFYPQDVQSFLRTEFEWD
jgi:hypothetical protein